MQIAQQNQELRTIKSGARCAWCDQESGRKPLPGETHGICPHHYEIQKREIKTRDDREILSDYANAN